MLIANIQGHREEKETKTSNEIKCNYPIQVSAFVKKSYFYC